MAACEWLVSQQTDPAIRTVFSHWAPSFTIAGWSGASVSGRPMNPLSSKHPSVPFATPITMLAFHIPAKGVTRSAYENMRTLSRALEYLIVFLLLGWQADR